MVEGGGLEVAVGDGGVWWLRTEVEDGGREGGGGLVEMNGSRGHGALHNSAYRCFELLNVCVS